MLTIERIQDKISAKYNIMNAQSNQDEDKESEKVLYVRQIKGNCYNCGTYRRKSRDYTQIK